MNSSAVSYVQSRDELRLASGSFLTILLDTLGMGASLRFCVKGSSMFPLLRHRDIISISPIIDPIRIGDIMAFVSDENKIVVHRFLIKRGKKYILKGDFMEKSRIETVEKNRILGRVTRIDRNGKRAFGGLGKGRILIAFLSRYSMLKPLSSLYSKVCIAIRHRLLRRSV